MVDARAIGVLAALAVLPPLLFAIWMRNREVTHREPMVAVLRAFLFGATVGALVALILNLLFDVGTARYAEQAGISAVLLTTVIGAPFIEELTKGLGLPSVRKWMTEWEDGIVYGAAIGLGFAATENFVYGLDALLTEGESLALLTMAMRMVSSMILHAGSSALLGYGYGRMVRRGGMVGQLIPYYLLAVLLHALYNFLVLESTGLGFLAAVVIVWVVIGRLNRRIQELDRLPHLAR